MTPWVYDGDLTAAHALGVGQLTIKKFKSPPLPHVVPGGGVGVHIDKCINKMHVRPLISLMTYSQHIAPVVTFHWSNDIPSPNS